MDLFIVFSLGYPILILLNYVSKNDATFSLAELCTALKVFMKRLGSQTIVVAQQIPPNLDKLVR